MGASDDILEVLTFASQMADSQPRTSRRTPNPFRHLEQLDIGFLFVSERLRKEKIYF